MIKLKDIITEDKKEVSKNAFEEFAETRMGGAEKITNDMHKKGGLALLTWHHYKVKLPYYKKASAGKLDVEKMKDEYNEFLEKLYKSTKGDIKLTQTEFQELVGRLEVLGELIIKRK